VGLSRSFYVEHGVPGGELKEFEYDVEVDDYEPYCEGRSSGPPEDCEPPSGGYATAVQGKVRRRMTDPDGPWELVPFSIFLEGYAFSRDIKDDPPEKPWPKKALDKALREIEDELYEYAEEHKRDEYEAAQEAKYDYRKENGDL
jgi:hypothetical protein